MLLYRKGNYSATKFHLKALKFLPLLVFMLIFSSILSSNSKADTPHCEDAQTQCLNQLNNLWNCAQNHCVELYVWCEAAHRPCANPLQAANDCYDRVCGDGYANSQAGGSTSFTGLGEVPFSRNKVSTFADIPETSAGHQPTATYFNPYENSGPTGTESFNDISNQFIGTYREGGPSDGLIPATYLEQYIVDQMIKDCFYNAGPNEKDYYDNVITPRLLSGATAKIERGNNANPDVPNVPCAWALDKAGF